MNLLSPPTRRFRPREADLPPARAVSPFATPSLHEPLQGSPPRAARRVVSARSASAATSSRFIVTIRGNSFTISTLHEPVQGSPPRAARRVVSARSASGATSSRFRIPILGNSSSIPALQKGFSLIEVIGVLAILAITAGIFVPNLAQSISRSRGAADTAEIAEIGAALLRYVVENQEIPGATSWSTAAAQMLGRSSREILYSIPEDTSTKRVFLIHPNFTPATSNNGTFADPIWSQGLRGALALRDARAMILSVHRAGLSLPVHSGPATTASVFSAIWDWNLDPSTEAPPAGWPSAWSRNGEYLHVERLNFEPLFHKVTFSNTQYPTRSPAVSIGAADPISLDTTAVYYARYLEGTGFRLYKHSASTATATDLQLAHALRSDINFVYANDQWSIP